MKFDKKCDEYCPEVSCGQTIFAFMHVSALEHTAKYLAKKDLLKATKKAAS